MWLPWKRVQSGFHLQIGSEFEATFKECIIACLKSAADCGYILHKISGANKRLCTLQLRRSSFSRNSLSFTSTDDSIYFSKPPWYLGKK